MSTTELLRVEDLHAWYGESQALHGVSLDVNRGELVTLLGRNGAGKTTTLRSLVGAIGRRSGSIRLHGRETVGWAPHRIAHLGVAYVPEERGIFAALSVEENLLLPPVLKPGGMTVAELYQLFPNLYERRKSPGTKLSGGEQQMLAIARVLRTGADLILLDEPSEGLAPVIVDQIGSLLVKLKTLGLTILLVEQNFNFARAVTDRFFIVEDGHITACIHADEVQQRAEEIDRCLGV